MSKRAALLVVFAILAMVGAQAASACTGSFECYCNGRFSGCFTSIDSCVGSCGPHPVPNILGVHQGPTSRPPAQHRPIVQRQTAADAMLVRIMAPAN
jgi:hypothetical protein